MKRFINLMMAAILGSGLTIGIFFMLNQQAKQNSSKISAYAGNTSSSKIPVYSTQQALADAPVDFTRAAEKVMPAVVHIRSKQTFTRNQQRNGQENMDERLRDFFGDDFRRFFQYPQEDVPREGIGSGVIISEDGYIVTNNHVVDNSDELEVSLTDNRTYTAKVVGSDPTTDIAVIKIEDDNLPYLRFADSDEVKVGEWVLAVGNPFNLSSTVTAGIVSAKGRAIGILREQYAIESFIQTDAAINPGNSGGALVNLNGDLIGINTAIATSTGSYAGYGFAVPVNLVGKVVEDLKEFGVVQRGVLGVAIRSVNSEIARENDLDVVNGVFIDSVFDNSSAEVAGIKQGDVIVEVEGVTIKTTSDLQAMIASRRPGDDVRITVDRNGDIRDINVKLKNLEGKMEAVAREKTEALDVLGAEFQILSKAELDRLKIKSGVQVSRIYNGKLRKDTDMAEGFIITHIDSQPVDEVDDIRDILNQKEGGILIEGIYPDRPDEKRFYAFGM